MPLHKKMEFEGKDVAEAIGKACKTFNVSQENLDIEVLTTGASTRGLRASGFAVIGGAVFSPIQAMQVPTCLRLLNVP